MILEVNHEDFEAGLPTEMLSESLTCYVENELSTDEFYGILEDYIPESGLEAWEGAEAYGLKPSATFKFDAATARVFEASDGCFVAFFSN
jgi:hypothetical protein